MNPKHQTVIDQIEDKRFDAHLKALNLIGARGRKYDFYRAWSATLAYREARTLLEQDDLVEVQALATDAIREWEHARESGVTERALAMADGRRDALLTVLDIVGGEPA